MKTIVSVQEIAELEIKPKPELAEWRRQVAAEIARRWSDRADWIGVACPACGSAGSEAAFETFGVAYVECAACGTVYAPRRPTEAMLEEYYRDSAAARYWREHVAGASAAARLEKIVRPRAEWVLDGVAEYAPTARRLVDVSANPRALLDELAKGAPGLAELVAAGRTADLDGGSSTGKVAVRPTPVRSLETLGATDLVTAFDVLDRTADVAELMRALRAIVRPGGLVFATAPTSTGFEMQVLWEKSPTVVPPDKLNLPSVEGLLRLFGDPDWEVLELSTPGMFDVEIVRRAVEQEPQAPWPRIVRYLLTRRDDAARQSLVEFLQSQRLTSFARLVARRRP